MNICITTKHYQITNSVWEQVERDGQKLRQRLLHLNPNPGLIKLVIKRNKRRNFFDGSIYFSIPKKHLYTYFKGIYADEAINHAFEHLFKELSKYKGKHFTNDSQYFRHESIGGSYGYQS